MTKRNITIVGIVLILIAAAIIGGSRVRVGVPAAGVREPVALDAGSAAVNQASLTHSVQRDVAAGEVGALVSVLKVKQTLAVVSRRVARRAQVVELAAVLRVVGACVDRVQVALV